MRYYVLTIASAATLVGCNREHRSGDFARSDDSVAEEIVATIGPNGEPRMFAADQDSSGTRLCFESTDSTLSAGSPVTVVHPAFPQYATTGKLGKRSKSPCFPPPIASPDSMEYVVEAPADTIGRRGVPIVILGKLPKAEMMGDTVTLEVERGKPRWRFRECASTEGIHTTAWAGVPLASPRRWHAYYYLGYDVEPDCLPADYDPDSAAAKT